MAINIETEAATHAAGVESALAAASAAARQAVDALGKASAAKAGSAQVKAFADAETRLSQAVLEARMLAASLEITRSRTAQMRKQVES